MSQRIRVALAISALLALLTMSACSLPAPTPADTSPRDGLASVDTTAQARAALEELFSAWDAHDVGRMNAVLTSGQAVREGDAIAPITVESITPLDPSHPRYISSNEARVSVCFLAPVRFYGDDLTFESGELLEWVWVVDLGDDGKWRVSNWGV